MARAVLFRRAWLSYALYPLLFEGDRVSRHDSGTVRGNLLRADMDSGFTYSNKTMRRSVVVVGLATSQAQFLNSFEHELRHLCDDIAAASGMPMQGEEVAYLTGDVNSLVMGRCSRFRLL